MAFACSGEGASNGAGASAFVGTYVAAACQTVKTWHDSCLLSDHLHRQGNTGKALRNWKPKVSCFLHDSVRIEPCKPVTVCVPWRNKQLAWPCTVADI